MWIECTVGCTLLLMSGTKNIFKSKYIKMSKAVHSLAHAKEECFNHIPAEIQRFTNLLPVSSGFVDASTVPEATKEQIRRVLPSVNFV